MIRAVVLYEGDVDPQRYAEHAELCRNVPGARFRHGRVFGAPIGEPQHRYYAEWEWPDLDAFKAAARSEQFMATGKDAIAMGVKFAVEFVELEG